MQNLNENKSTIPKYLEELVKPTPLSVEKLLAAWDGLSFETQLMILSEYVSNFPQHYRHKICLKSISSKNDYVRLISKNIGNFSNYKDTSLLVSSNYYLPKWCIPLPDNPIYSPEKFLNLNQIERLIIVSTLDGFGEHISNIVKYYYTNRLTFENTSEEQIFDILCEYFKGSGLKNYKSGEMSFDGYDEFLKGEEIAAIWNLIPIVSESIAYLLIENLPANSGFTSFTKDIIPNLPEKYLVWFLSNKNNHVSEFRKSIFKSDTYSNKIKEAAICCHFYLNEYEFSEIIKYDTKKRFGIIDALVFAGDLDICSIKAISDLLRLETDIDYMSIRICNKNVSRKFIEISSESQPYQANLIRLYEIAKRILPWDEINPREYNFPIEVGLLKIDTSGLNTWEIFVKMKEQFDWAYKFDDEITIILDKMVDVKDSIMLPKEDGNSLLLKKVYKQQEEIINQIKLSKTEVDFVDVKNCILYATNESTKKNDLIEIKASIVSSISEQLESIMNIIEKQGQQQNRLQERLDNLENNSNIIKNRIQKYSYIIFFSYLSYTISQKFFN